MIRCSPFGREATADRTIRPMPEIAQADTAGLGCRPLLHRDRQASLGTVSTFVESSITMTW